MYEYMISHMLRRELTRSCCDVGAVIWAAACAGRGEELARQVNQRRAGRQGDFRPSCGGKGAC